MSKSLKNSPIKLLGFLFTLADGTKTTQLPDEKLAVTTKKIEFDPEGWKENPDKYYNIDTTK